jgi:PPOX class probable F420-dependent enzyme
VVPIWFDLDEETLVFTTWYTSVKARNIQRDPRVCICVDDETPPFAFVKLEGTASLSDADQDLAYWSARIAGRYMGRDRAAEFGERNAVEGELVVRVTPSRISGTWDMAG